MTPKRLLFRACVRSLEWLTLHSQPTEMHNLPLQQNTPPNTVDLITVAFNNVKLIRLQEQFLRKFIRDPYTHIIADNSSNPEARKTIRQFCTDNGIAYIGLPINHLNRIGSSYSHANALNYVYRHVIRHRRPYAFGIIDHDLFPIRPVTILDKLESQPIYGPLRRFGNEWYLSAIMSFFKYDYVADKRVDFMPVTPNKHYLDSGGGNWYDIYSRLDIKSLVFPTECVLPFRSGGDRHSDSLEYFDDKHWLHTINGSCWKAIPGEEEKNQHIIQLLQSILDN